MIDPIHNRSNATVEMIKDFFIPYRFGYVIAPPRVSPSMSSMSLMISLPKLKKTAKNAGMIPAAGLPAATLPYMNAAPVTSATRIFPVKGVRFNFALYANIRTALAIAIRKTGIEMKPLMINPDTKQLHASTFASVMDNRNDGRIRSGLLTVSI